MDNSLYAAVDLGSNSFHMVIARLTEGRLQIVDRIKERVRLAEDGRPAPHVCRSHDPGLDCLALFAERLTNIKPDQIRIAGTYTLRRASNAREFVSEAAKVLNHPIEIISGQEEARLIYQGSPIPSTSRARYWWWTLAVAAQSSSSARASITRRSPAARWAASASPRALPTAS